MDFSSYRSALLHFAVSLVAVGIHLSVCRAVVCPSPYSDIHGVCLNFTTTKMKWCDAQSYCSSVGGELVRGSNFLAIASKSFTGRSKRFWIGLTDLLQEMGSNRPGWRWSDGSLDPPSSQLNWNHDEPANRGNGREDCMRTCGLEVCDQSCITNLQYAGVPMCQQRSLPPSLARSREFEAIVIPVGLSSRDFADGGGCSRLVTDVRSEIECAILCCIDSKDACVSFYFNKGRKECRLQLYTDATVDMGDAQGWVKFVMRN